mgnify:FL=1
MTYASRTDLEARYGEDEIAQRESMLPTGAVERALADADAEIDSYVASRYTVPLSPVPQVIPRLACAIARYHLLGDSATETARKDYEDARAWLRDLHSGRALLEGATPLSGTSPARTVEIATREKLFSGGLR